MFVVVLLRDIAAFEWRGHGFKSRTTTVPESLFVRPFVGLTARITKLSPKSTDLKSYD